jgi:hypothetical protein
MIEQVAKRTGCEIFLTQPESLFPIIIFHTNVPHGLINNE